MAELLWKPSEERIKSSNMYKFMQFVNERHGTDFQEYMPLYRWSVESIPEFWATFWDYAEIKCSKTYDTVVDDLTKMPGAKWFHGAKLNFAENLLRYRDDHTALIFRGETQKKATMSYAELYDTVVRLAKSLREIGISPGDRVTAYMPNMMETAIAMLAATSIGATWSSCATDIGSGAVIDRFGQIEPKVLFTVNGYYYKGKAFHSLGNAAEVVKGIPSIEKVVVTSYTEEEPDLSTIPNSVHWDEFLAKEGGLEIQFEQLPFDHPVYIMFSSGTTGKPKCLVQGAGGILINHLKELILHTDLTRDDVHFFITTCSWMMWNWIMSSLAVGNTLILYDGNPAYPDIGAMWKLIQDEKVTMFGTSASYINVLNSMGVKPGKDFDLSSLKEIWQTGSPLSPEGFYAGQLQFPALAMKINTYDDAGKPVVDQEGELVCEAPAPSMPLYFWNDPDGAKYHSAYFDVYPNVWRHGDYVKIDSETNGITFFGRSDAVLKPSGVRIGTAEIYNQVEKFEEIADSLAIGQNWEGDQRIILFVKLAEARSRRHYGRRPRRDTFPRRSSRSRIYPIP